MGMFSGIEKATHENNDSYIQKGKHLLEIASAQYRESEWKGKSFIVKFEVAETNNKAVEVGSKCAWVKKLDVGPKLKRSLGEIKSLMAAAMECGQDTITDKKASEWVENDTLVGKVVACEGRDIMIGDNKDVPYTVIDFSMVEE